MTKAPDSRTPLSCEAAEALMDERISGTALTPEQTADLETHLADCKTCSDIAKITSDFPLFVGTPGAQETRAAARRLSTEYHHARHRRRLLVGVFVATAAAGLLVFSLPRLFSVPAEETDVPCVASSPFIVEPGVLMTYCAGPRPESHLDDGNLRFYLRKGAVGLAVDPNRTPRVAVSVHTPDGEVRVKGTVFSVRTDGTDSWVEVFRGEVEVRPLSPASSFTTAEGYGSRLARENRSPLAAPITTPLYQALEDALRDAGEAAVQNADASGVAAATDEDTGSNSETIDAPSKMRTKKPLKRPPTRATAPTPAIEADTLLQEARACMIARNWGCAAAKYREFLSRHTGRPGSESALISLAKLELLHLNDPSSALRHYSAYQRRAANGPLAEEALFGIAGAYRKLGNTSKEAAALRQFIDRYPRSTLTAKAESRLKEIEKRD